MEVDIKNELESAGISNTSWILLRGISNIHWDIGGLSGVGKEGLLGHFSIWVGSSTSGGGKL